MRKKLGVLLSLLSIFILCTANVYAEGSINEKNSVRINVHIGDIENFKVSNAEMALYNMNDEQLGVLNLEINETNTDKTIEFIVDKYIAGEEFYLKFLNNIDCVEFNSQFYGINTKIPLKTYCDYFDEKGKLINGNVFSMNAYPLAHQKIILKHNSKVYQTDFPVNFC